MAAPKLRFKEFDGDWSDSKLGQLIGISSASRVFKEQWQTSGVPFFRTSDVVSIFKNKENEKAYISLELFEELSKKSGKIQKEDLLVTGGGTIGIPYLVENDEPLYFKDADLLWIKSSGVINGSFLYNFFISPKFREYLKSISHTGTISHFTIEQAKVTPFQYPSKEEQTKIASFLSTVDEKIGQLNQKHQLLSQYKQGMMQKLFSQQIRFKADDGSEFGEWLFSEIGDVFKFKQGKQVSIEDQDLYKTDASTRFIRIVDLTSTDEPHRYIIDYSKNDLIEKDDLFMVRYGSPGLLGFGYEGVIANNLFRIIPIHPKQVFSKFSYYLFDSLYQQVCQLSSSTTMPAISFASLNTLKVCLPCLEEQTKISAFLSSIDKKIEVVTQQIEQAKQWKKGLLQQMFV